MATPGMEVGDDTDLGRRPVGHAWSDGMLRFEGRISNSEQNWEKVSMQHACMIVSNELT